MSKLLPASIRIKRAKAKLTEARSVLEFMPDGGQKRGQAVRRVRSLLNDAESEVIRFRRIRRYEKTLMEAERNEIDRILTAVDELWPDVL